MTRRRRGTRSKPSSSDVDAALAATGAEDLREIVRELMLELGDRAHRRVAGRLIDRAARKDMGWTPARPSSALVAEVLAFAEAAQRVGHADADDVDDYLQQGSNAFLGKDYATALEVFRALLIPISEAEIDLGQHEMVDEVLGADVGDCAKQYVVSIYMTVTPDQRAHAVCAAINEMSCVGHFREPLREMERASVEPLPELDEFLPRWRALIEEPAAAERRDAWDSDQDRWLREVVQRTEGVEGLARVARSTCRADDLHAWCRMSVESRDWKAALSAYAEAAEIVAGEADSRGDFLDGAALAAQELGRKDLPVRLERAWRQAPTLLRLRRWLGSSASKRSVRVRARHAGESCPKDASRQRAFLHVLLGEHSSAAKLLAAAPGLGWSNSEHPGHLLFPLLGRLLGAAPSTGSPSTPLASRCGMDIDEPEWMSADSNEPRLTAPTLDEVVGLAGVEGPVKAADRKVVLRAMRKATEQRLDGVTENKRRRYYAHAAELVAVVTALDPTPACDRWVSGIRANYRRFPALQRELDDQVGPAGRP